MDSTNMLDLHYHPEELLHSSSALTWNQLLYLNDSQLIPGLSDEHLINPSVASYMVQDLGLRWTGHGHHHSAQQLHLAKIKDEEETLLHDLSRYNAPPHFTNGDFGFDPLSLGMCLPSAVSFRSSLMPLQTSDQFSRISSCHATSIHGCPSFDNINYGVQHHLQAPAEARNGFSLNEMPAPVNGVHENKRASSSMDQAKPSKKPRFESRPSFSPFKVRKEKLGDRIAALQQLVAPFGKTDTASVLMEAIGYIKFLQDQVETLSVPYIGPSNNKKLRKTTEASSANERDEPRPDLRTRGLCLVPLTCTSYVTDDNIVWPSRPNFS